jgi:hypothetical protein
MMWLTQMPRAMVRAHLLMLPRIQAEESLRVVQQVGAGTGSFTGDTGRSLLRSWSRTAQGEGAITPERATSKTALQTMGARVGIGYREVKRP